MASSSSTELKVREIGPDHLGYKVEVVDYQGSSHRGVLYGIEHYQMPRRTVLHMAPLGTSEREVFVHPNFDIKVLR